MGEGGAARRDQQAVTTEELPGVSQTTHYLAWEQLALLCLWSLLVPPVPVTTPRMLQQFLSQLGSVEPGTMFRSGAAGFRKT